VDFTYLRLPVEPYWAVTIVNDSYQYNESRSVQFEYPQECFTDLANLIIGYASVNLQSQINLQASQLRKTEGQ
jgi:uncharacterized membrane protein